MSKFLDVFIFILCTAPMSFWFSVSLLLSGFYILIAPIIFHFWIIPKIEKRYGSLKSKNPTPRLYEFYIYLKWMMPSVEISKYIVFKYLNIRAPSMKRPWPGTHTEVMKEKNYTIENASKSEIIMSFSVIIAITIGIVSGVVVSILTM